MKKRLLALSLMASSVLFSCNTFSNFYALKSENECFSTTLNVVEGVEYIFDMDLAKVSEYNLEGYAAIKFSNEDSNKDETIIKSVNKVLRNGVIIDRAAEESESKVGYTIDGNAITFTIALRKFNTEKPTFDFFVEFKGSYNIKIEAKPDINK